MNAWLRSWFWLALLAALSAAAVPLLSQADERYVGSETCQSCHQAEYSDWTQSHHFRAMQTASPETVLGDFNDARFGYGGLNHRFFRQGEKFMVETDNAKGALETFEIKYTFGFEPLQQYLIDQ